MYDKHCQDSQPEPAAHLLKLVVVSRSGPTAAMALPDTAAVWDQAVMSALTDLINGVVLPS